MAGVEVNCRLHFLTHETLKPSGMDLLGSLSDMDTGSESDGDQHHAHDASNHTQETSGLGSTARAHTTDVSGFDAAFRRNTADSDSDDEVQRVSALLARKQGARGLPSGRTHHQLPAPVTASATQLLEDSDSGSDHADDQPPAARASAGAGHPTGSSANSVSSRASAKPTAGSKGPSPALSGLLQDSDSDDDMVLQTSLVRRATPTAPTPTAIDATPSAPPSRIPAPSAGHSRLLTSRFAASGTTIDDGVTEATDTSALEPSLTTSTSEPHASRVDASKSRLFVPHSPAMQPSRRDADESFATGVSVAELHGSDGSDAALGPNAALVGAPDARHGVVEKLFRYFSDFQVHGEPMLSHVAFVSMLHEAGVMDATFSGDHLKAHMLRVLGDSHAGRLAVTRSQCAQVLQSIATAKYTTLTPGDAWQLLHRNYLAPAVERLIAPPAVMDRPAQLAAALDDDLDDDQHDELLQPAAPGGAPVSHDSSQAPSKTADDGDDSDPDGDGKDLAGMWNKNMGGPRGTGERRRTGPPPAQRPPRVRQSAPGATAEAPARQARDRVPKSRDLSFGGDLAADRGSWRMQQPGIRAQAEPTEEDKAHMTFKPQINQYYRTDAAQQSFAERQAKAEERRRLKLLKLHQSMWEQEQAILRQRGLSEGSKRLIRKSELGRETQAQTVERLYQDGLAPRPAAPTHDEKTGQKLFQPLINHKRTEDRATVGSSVQAGLALYDHAMDQLRRQEELQAQQEARERYLRNAPKMNKGSLDHLRRKLTKLICAAVTSLFLAEDVTGQPLTERQLGEWAEVELDFGSMVEVLRLTSFIRTTPEMQKAVDSGARPWAWASPEEQECLLRLWSALTNPVVQVQKAMGNAGAQPPDRVYVSMMVSFLQALCTGSSMVAPQYMQMVDELTYGPGRMDPEVWQHQDDEGDQLEDQVDFDAGALGGAAVDFSAPDTLGQGDGDVSVDLDFSGLSALMHKHKQKMTAMLADRVGAESGLAMGVDADGNLRVGGEDRLDLESREGQSVSPTGFEPGSPVWQVAMGFNVTWDTALLSTFRLLSNNHAAGTMTASSARLTAGSVIDAQASVISQSKPAAVLPSGEEHCTFAPAICAKSREILQNSKRYQGATTESYSTLLYQRAREAEQRRDALRLQALREEEQSCTFKPKVTALKDAEHIRSRPNVVSRLYELHQEKQRRLEREAEKAEEERKAKEVEECTFQPKINPAPSEVVAQKRATVVARTKSSQQLRGAASGSAMGGDDEEAPSDGGSDSDDPFAQQLAREAAGLVYGGASTVVDEPKPVPKGFSKSIERLRKARMEREEKKRIEEHIRNGVVAESGVVRDERGRTKVAPFSLATDKRSKERTAAQSKATRDNSARAQCVTEASQKTGRQVMLQAPPPPMRNSSASAAPSSVRSFRSGPPLLHVDINITPIRTERISIWEGDDLITVATQFAADHSLDSGMAERLALLLAQQRDAVMAARK